MKPLLYVDMDGVIADFDAVISKYNPAVDTSRGEFRDAVDEICEANTRIFLEIEPIPGGIEAVNILKDHYDIYFLSTPMWNVPDSFGDKRIWLEKHFGSFAHKRLILTHRKDLNLGKYLIDDRKTNGSEAFTGEHIHFGTDQFPTWDSVLKYLL
jgi:5'-nucleotidase